MNDIQKKIEGHMTLRGGFDDTALNASVRLHTGLRVKQNVFCYGLLYRCFL